MQEKNLKNATPQEKDRWMVTNDGVCLDLEFSKSIAQETFKKALEGAMLWHLKPGGGRILLDRK